MQLKSYFQILIVLLGVSFFLQSQMDNKPTIRFITWITSSKQWEPIFDSIGRDIGVNIVCSEGEPTRSGPALDTFHDWFYHEDAFGWICSVSFALGLEKWGEDSPAQLLVAPILKGCSEPTYFSYLIVNKDSEYYKLEDLKNTVFTYNDDESISGFILMKWWLKQQNLKADFFKKATCSGAHINSINSVLNKTADCAIIDVQVYQRQLLENPAWNDKIRIISESPKLPIQPLITSPTMNPEIRQKLLDALLTFGKDEKERKMLNDAYFSKFTELDVDLYKQNLEAFRSTLDMNFPN